MLKNPTYLSKSMKIKSSSGESACESRPPAIHALERSNSPLRCRHGRSNRELSPRESTCSDVLISAVTSQAVSVQFFSLSIRNPSSSIFSGQTYLPCNSLLCRCDDNRPVERVASSPSPSRGEKGPGDDAKERAGTDLLCPGVRACV